MKLNPFRLSKEERAQVDALIERRSISFQDVWGQGRDVGLGGPVTMERAMSLAPIYAATSLIADTICGFPLESYRKVKGVVTKMEPQNKLLQSPSAFAGPIAWTHRAVISLALRGNAYGLITGFDAFGYPTGIEWLHPDEVSLRSDRTVAPPQWFWLGKPIDNSKMIHIPYYTVPGRILGISPIRAYAMNIQSGLLAQQFGRDFFANSSIPSGILTTEQPLKEDEAKTASDRFRRQSHGRGTAVLGHGITYKPISIAPEESQFLATLKLTATQIAAVYHIPPEMVGGESSGSMTYTNIDGWPIILTRLALTPYIVRIEEALEQYMPGGQLARYNMDAFQRPDMTSRVQSYHLALTDQWMEVDEVRQDEGLAPFGGDKGGLLELPAKTGSLSGEPSPSGPAGQKDPTGAAPKNDTPTDGSGKGLPSKQPSNKKGVGQGSVEGNSSSEEQEMRKSPQQLLAELHLRMGEGWELHG